jgi:hypothetical protein
MARGVSGQFAPVHMVGALLLAAIAAGCVIAPATPGTPQPTTVSHSAPAPSVSPVAGASGEAGRPTATPTADQPPTHEPTAITAEAAVAAVRPFLPDGATDDLKATLDPLAPTLYAVDGQSLSAWVDAMTGRVASVRYTDSMPDSPRVNKIQAQAQAAAAAFLAAHGIPFGGMTASVELRDHGDSKEYVVVWQRVVNQILFDDERQVSVNPATGNVYAFHDLRPASSDPLAPVLVTKDAAIRAAIAASGFGGDATVDPPHLEVSRNPQLPRRVVWSVEVSSGISHAMIWIDAETGAATIVGRG